ncbi:hypothetical protein J2S43_003106 [Catenuloplanes nepalensis]|uniref:FHA domain-containing protein n=1 Tax=Catenuloplanes nepalensis TaxID=587533 RepID=A0ABT9MT38_9ACTN|nr:FHA domain-containing protein [Catenuloplanes nepalensis]MDP9794594.1 hypothetical protein [Catenuloplanes nepalensis]
MTTATCPKGHDSATLDYCDTCGAPMDGARVPDAVTGSGAPDPDVTQPVSPGCPRCGTPQDGRFCEVDGYDFLLAPPLPETPTAPIPPPGPAAGPAAGSAPRTGPGAAGTAAQPAGRLEVVVGADRAYFDGVVAQGGEDAGGMVFPRFAAQRRFPLTGERLLIGRRSRSRGVHPDIDLASPPEDPGVSHTHALLLNEGGKWSIVDLGSANGTYVNDPASAPIPAENPFPLRPGDRVYVGAWTSLTVREAQ